MTTSKPPKLGLILNTRPNHHRERFHEAFGDLPWAIFDCPLTRAEPIGASFPGPDGFDTIIFTSQLAVSLFIKDEKWRRKRILTVGEVTGQMAVRAGYPDVISTGETVDDLRRYLNETPFTKAFYPSADDVTAELDKEFPGKIERVPVYKMVGRDELPRQFIDQALRMRVVVPLFSRRNAEIFAQLCAKAGITKDNSAIVAVGISPDIFEGLEGPWHNTTSGPKPTQRHMVTVTEMVISRMSV